jgi:phosphopantetheinyl transferase
MKTLAFLVLNPREREAWERLNSALPARRREWLLGRCAAKDAVRELLRKHAGMELCAADVEVVSDANGKPLATGLWKEQLREEVAISIAHSDGVAAAVAQLGTSRIGFDMERASRRTRGFENAAFSEKERQWVSSLPESDRQQWLLRLWCAKEALSKALGTGLANGLQSICMIAADPVTGQVQMNADHLPGKILVASTQADADWITGFSVVEGRLS